MKLVLLFAALASVFGFGYQEVASRSNAASYKAAAKHMQLAYIECEQSHPLSTDQACSSLALADTYSKFPKFAAHAVETPAAVAQVSSADPVGAAKAHAAELKGCTGTNPMAECK